MMMHGGSGFAAEQYGGCIESGISSIHIYTNITTGLWSFLESNFFSVSDKLIYHEIVEWTMQYYYSQTVKVIDMLTQCRQS
jgi:fructose-bisphosphate aldolase class II